MRNDSIALTVNRLCGSGFQAIISGAFEINSGEAAIGLVGGSESMSQVHSLELSVKKG
jgi:acetyl-CoA acyltransferase 2